MWIKGREGRIDGEGEGSVKKRERWETEGNIKRYIGREVKGKVWWRGKTEGKEGRGDL